MVGEEGDTDHDDKAAIYRSDLRFRLAMPFISSIFRAYRHVMVINLTIALFAKSVRIDEL